MVADAILAHGRGALALFFTPAEAAAFDAIAARIWPGGPEDPGAREGGAVDYLDRALAGAYASLQPIYRAWLGAVDAAATARHGTVFARLPEREQDALLAAMEQEQVPGFAQPSAAEFLRLCIRHTMEGMLSDPVHGGNRGFAGWNAVGYPGAQDGYTADEQTQFERLRRPPRSVAEP
jgi:hypothetical protein